MMAVVVDTNVAKVANGDAAHAGLNCQLACLRTLADIRKRHRILLDDKGFILSEYLKQKPHGFPQGAGDAFLVWVYDNQANPAHVGLVPVTPLGDDPRGFAEFPADEALADFDSDDRKFVAVALASGLLPTVYNAADTDWWDYRRALKRHHVNVEFLCPELMAD